MNSVLIEMKPKDLKNTINGFKEAYPKLVKRGISYEPYDHMSIIVYIPGMGKLIYEYFGDKIAWLEKWTDERETKKYEKEHRHDLYEMFLERVTEYIIEHRMTQQEFADLVGISRQSLSKYLNGDKIPKVSTMRQICEKLYINI